MHLATATNVPPGWAPVLSKITVRTVTPMGRAAPKAALSELAAPSHFAAEESVARGNNREADVALDVRGELGKNPCSRA